MNGESDEHLDEEMKDEVMSLPEAQSVKDSVKSSKISELEAEILKEKEAWLRLEKEIEEFKKVTQSLLQAINKT